MAARQAIHTSAVVSDNVWIVPILPNQPGGRAGFINDVFDRPRVRPGELHAVAIIENSEVSVRKAADMVLCLKIGGVAVARNGVSKGELVVLALHAPHDVPG